MRRMLVMLVAIPVLAAALAAPVAAKAPGWDYSGWAHLRYVPEAMGPGVICGVPYASMTATGYVDFWFEPMAAGVQRSVQHWDGALTFTAADGATVTAHEDDWRFVVDSYRADGTGYTEESRANGLLEELRSTGDRRLADAGQAITRIEYVFPIPGNTFWIEAMSVEVLSLHGTLPMRHSGYDLADGGWNAECAFFQACLG